MTNRRAICLRAIAIRWERDKRPLSERFWSKVKKPAGDMCWEWQGSFFRHGYGQISLKEGNKKRTKQAHRVAWELTHGPIPDGLWVLHKCDNPACCNPHHLFLGTPKDNQQDCIAKGRKPIIRGPAHPNFGRNRGERAYNHKLTEKAVREIRSLYGSGSFTQTQLAERFGVGQSSIFAVIHRNRSGGWCHVE